MKKFNRLCELKLRDAELLLTVAFVLYRIPVLEIPDLRAKIDEAWRLLLVNQFHDVLPGSSIELAHTEAKKWFAESLSLTQQVIDKCISFFGGHSTTLQDSNCLLNTLPWKRNALIYDGVNPVNSVELQPMSFNVLSNKLHLTPLLLGKCEFLHYLKIKLSIIYLNVDLDETGGSFKIANQFFTVEFDLCGRVVSLVHHSSGNQVMPAHLRGNQFVIFDDIPLFWDAWDTMDYHLETRQTVNSPSSSPAEAIALHVELVTPLKITLKWSQPIGQKSQLNQWIHVSAIDPYIEFETRINWAENRKFLKVEFPVEVHANQVISTRLHLQYQNIVLMINFLA